MTTATLGFDPIEMAQQAADLINANNKLAVELTAQDIIRNSDQYLFVIEGLTLLGCVRVSRKQWYQSEISHLSVRANRRGQGLGKQLVTMALRRAVKLGTPVVQCTIRSDNAASIATFESLGFCSTVSFFNQETGNEVIVFQTALVEAQP